MLQLKVLGGLCMKRDGRVLSGALAQPRRLAVLALLARGGQAGVPRDRVISTLWPDVDEERARHTLNQTLYAIRRELGGDEVIVGIRELRLNEELLAIDATDFQAAAAERNLQRAIESYDGPFLEGFHLAGSDEFERWSDRERASLDRMYTNVLEQMARDATTRGDHARAVGWWRTRAARDPLDARVALALMQSLDAAGERLAAIQHARVYELLIDEELSLPPDGEVVRYAEELRRQQIVAAEAAAGDVAEPSVLADEIEVSAPNVVASDVTRTDVTPTDTAAPSLVASVIDPQAAMDSPAVLPATQRAAVVPTRWRSPIRAPHVWTAFLAAAALIAAVALGAIAGHRHSTPDVTAGAAAGMSPAQPAPIIQSAGDVTTRSITAYRMYEQGLKAHARGDRPVARKFFEAAVAEDSLFALAHYYLAVTIDDPVDARRRLLRAHRLATTVSDRERLTINAGWASTLSVPTFRAISDTLAIRYPTDVVGQVNLAMALVSDGEYLEALQPLQHVVSLGAPVSDDAAAEVSLGTAMRTMVSAYEAADSLAAAERVARRWVRMQPGSRAAVRALVEVLDAQGRAEDGDAVLRATTVHVLEDVDALYRRAANFVRAGRFDDAERLLCDMIEAGSVYEQIDAYWMLAISLRQQGRLADALAATRRMRAILPDSSATVAGSAPTIAALEAQILLELGRPRAASALFDSIARGRDHLDSKANEARRQTWNLTHSAGARAAAGDTMGLARLVDSIQSSGLRSGHGRDRRLHHYVRGLLLVARGEDEGAAVEFSRAMLSRNFGYTRANYELARTLVRLGRPADAVAVLQPALRGGMEGANLYVSRTELHELLAQAWDAAGRSDSALTHYRVVADEWRLADRALQPRRAAAISHQPSAISHQPSAISLLRSTRYVAGKQ